MSIANDMIESTVQEHLDEITGTPDRAAKNGLFDVQEIDNGERWLALEGVTYWRACGYMRQCIEHDVRTRDEVRRFLLTPSLDVRTCDECNFVVPLEAGGPDWPDGLCPDCQ